MVLVYTTAFTCYLLWSSCILVQSFLLDKSRISVRRLLPQQHVVQRSGSKQTNVNNNNNNLSNTNAVTMVLYATGGWGIGPQRELTPEEFATGGVQNKKYFEGYQIRNRGEFMRQVALDKDEMVRGEIDELLGVAALAGLTVKNPKERLNKFDPSIINNDDDDELDVSVQWDTSSSTQDFENNNNNQPEISPVTSLSDTTTTVSATTDSITRMDEDTGSLGVW